jgi:hypothetical protein
MEGDQPAAAASPRVPVTTRPKKDGKPPKRKTERLYGATRTDSGFNLQRASPGRYVQASPATISAWQNAIDTFTLAVDPQTLRPADIDLVAQGNEAFTQNIDDARAELGIDATDAEVYLRAADRSIQDAREIAQTDPEKAGAILVASNVGVNLAQQNAPPEQQDDFRFEAMSGALEHTFSGLRQTKSPFTPSKTDQSRGSRRFSVSTESRRRQLFSPDDDEDVFENSEEEQADEPAAAYARYDPRRLIWGNQPAAQEPAPVPGALTAEEYEASISNRDRDRTVSGSSVLSADEFFHDVPDDPFDDVSAQESPIGPARQTPAASPAGSAASTRHSGSPHLSAVVSGTSNPDERLQQLANVRQQLRATAALPSYADIQAARAAAQQAVDASPALRVPPAPVTPLQVAQAAVNALPAALPVVGPQVAAAQNNPVQQIAAMQPGAVNVGGAPGIAGALPGGAPPGPAPPIGPALQEIRRAVERIGTQQELTPAQLSTAILNIEGGPDPDNPGRTIPAAPLTGQLFAQGKLNARQLLDPVEVQAYETALRQRRVRKEADGSEERVYNTRLSAQPVLTRYVEEPSTGAKRYRPPRFAGPAY